MDNFKNPNIPDSFYDSFYNNWYFYQKYKDKPHYDNPFKIKYE